MNKNTRQLRKSNRSGINNGATHAEVTYEPVKGRCVNSSAERKASGKKPFMGAIKQRPKSFGAPAE